MIVVDTDVLSIIDTARGTDFDRIRRHVERVGDQAIVTTIVTVEEQLRGWLSYIAASKQPDREVTGYRELLRTLRRRASQVVLEYDQDAMEQFQDLRRSKVRVGTMDLKIAAIAISRGLPLATRNMRDYARIPGLELLDWSK